MVNTTHKLWNMYTIKDDTYLNQKNTIKTIAQPNFLAVRAGVDENVVCKITKLIFKNQTFFHNVHPSTDIMFTGADEMKKAVEALPFKVHPGAARYYKNMSKSKPCDNSNANDAHKVQASG